MPVPAGPLGFPVFSASPCESWVAADCVDWPASTGPVREAALMAATEILWEKTKKRFGFCEYVLRPCAEECGGADALAWLYGSWMPTWGASGGGWGWPYPALIGGTWLNLGCSSCQGTCSCTELQQIQLPYPVSEIIEVKVDGVELDPSDYRVDQWQWLVRLDGERWPRCQDLSLADTEVGTWSVTAIYGEQVPSLGAFAVQELGLWIALNCATSCRTQNGVVTQIDRQGVSQKLQPGMLGPVATEFVQTYNPTSSGIATLIDIDGRQRNRRIGT